MHAPSPQNIGQVKWVRQGIIARSSRPGYPDKKVSSETVFATIAAWKRQGIESVLCLLDKQQLNYYEDLPEGLLRAYETAELFVEHVPVKDHKYPPLNDTELRRTLECFKRIRKPVLIHCSAGIDRTGQVINAIEILLQRGLA